MRAETKNLLLVAEMTKEKSVMQMQLKTSLAAINVERSLLEAEKKESTSELLKFQNRLLLLESAYEDSEVSEMIPD